ncbi:MAG TPA: nucleotide exchange factor GrpE [Candidatus Limnocylindrales bacterium]|nr:nucleotide exchange factor GrpE [Candidatus Limnocylindrales bacterium]
MEDRTERAERLLQERMTSRDGGGAEAPAPHQPEAGSTAEREDELTRDLQRLAADFANYRKRNEAERIDFAKYAKADLIARLLDVLDGYDRALATVPEDLADRPWVQGISLVERKLRGILEAEGLEPIPTVGAAFDPYVHEAVATVPSEAPEGTVVEEHQKGYRIHDRVVRPALVAVSKGPRKE